MSMTKDTSIILKEVSQAYSIADITQIIQLDVFLVNFDRYYLNWFFFIISQAGAMKKEGTKVFKAGNYAAAGKLYQKVGSRSRNVDHIQFSLDFFITRFMIYHIIS